MFLWGLAACACVGLLGGALFGLVRGLHYLPTVPFAVVEGSLIVGVPAAAFGVPVGLLMAGVEWSRRRR